MTTSEHRANTKLYEPGKSRRANMNQIIRNEFEVAQRHSEIPVIQYNYSAKNLVEKKKTIVNKLLFSEGARIGDKSHFTSSLENVPLPPPTYYHEGLKQKASGETKSSEIENELALQNGLMYTGFFFIVFGIGLYILAE